MTKGHNVILFSTIRQRQIQQSLLCCLKRKPHLAEAMILLLVTGFLQIHLQTIQHGKKSTVFTPKKHMFDDPELVERKRRANTRSLKEMAVLLRNGSQIVWIAPSGGRDRLSGQTGNGYLSFSNDNPKHGYNAATGNYEDLMAAGIIESLTKNLSICEADKVRLVFPSLH
ncbi:hypothetical protein HPP92_020501 [Vanilla planifolia]|uniref:Uncharacterized protein n=1 Tax=Vanilla planifolia TaxID=51239 RepID=A0A835UII3_VANPL|nr:hypothetical protein HPP92_020501 [Vanilla planifolia]